MYNGYSSIVSDSISRASFRYFKASVISINLATDAMNKFCGVRAWDYFVSNYKIIAR